MTQPQQLRVTDEMRKLAEQLARERAGRLDDVGRAQRRASDAIAQVRELREAPDIKPGRSIESVIARFTDRPDPALAAANIRSDEALETLFDTLQLHGTTADTLQMVATEHNRQFFPAKNEPQFHTKTVRGQRDLLEALDRFVTELAAREGIAPPAEGRYYSPPQPFRD